MCMNVYVVVQIFILGVSLSFYNLFWSLIVYDDKIETVGNKIEPQHILVLKLLAKSVYCLLHIILLADFVNNQNTLERHFHQEVFQWT